MSGSKLETASSWVSIVGVPVIIAATLGVGIPTMISQAKDIGKIEQRLNNMDASIARIETRLDGMDTKLTDLGDRVDGLAREVVNEGARPFEILQASGVAVEGDFFSAAIGGQVYVFAKDDEGAKQLDAAGYTETQITPFLAGWTASRDQ